MKKAFCVCICALLCAMTALPAGAGSDTIDQFNQSGALHWSQIPIVSKELLDTDAVTIGGEGCQWPLDITSSADDSVLFMATDVAGIYRSTDRGETWVPLSAGMHCRGCSCVCIDPNNNSRVLITGAGSEYFDVNGVYLSTDMGKTWNQKLSSKIWSHRDIRSSVVFDGSSYSAALGGSAAAYYSPLYDNTDKQDAAAMGLFRSDDGGSTWTMVNTTMYSADLHVGSDGTLYAAKSDALWVSTDRGVTFTKRWSGNITGSDLVRDKVMNADKLVLSTDCGITVSYDGVNFSEMDAPTYPTCANISGLAGRAKYIEVSPVDPDYMLVCYERSNLFNNINYYTHDGGKTWHASVTNKDYIMMGYPNVRNCTFAWSGTDRDTVHTFGGDFITSSRDGGATFTWDSNGYCGIFVGSEIHFNVYDSDLMYFGAQDYNGAMTADGGQTWKYINFSQLPWGGDVYGGYAADENTLFAGVAASWMGDREVCVSFDGGKTIIHTGKTYSVSDGVLTKGMESGYQSPTDANVFFQTFFRSADGGHSWDKMDGVLGVYAHDTDSGRLYGIDTSRHYVIYSDDEGVTWSHYNTEPIGTNYVIDDISADSVNDTVWVAYGERCAGKVTPDGSFTCVLSKELGNAPLNEYGRLCVKTVAVDPNRPEIVYCGGSGNYYNNIDGVLRSTDGGKSWQCVTPGEENSIVSADTMQCSYEPGQLIVDPGTGELWNATHCYGLCRLSSPYSASYCAARTRRSYTATFMANGGVYERDAVREGLTVCVPSASPSKAGAVFDGWYTDEACTVRFDPDRRVNGDITLYAGWTQALTVTLRDGDSTKTVTAGKGQTVSLPDGEMGSGKLCFAGWYTDAALTSAFDASAELTADITLYAGYAQNIFDSSAEDYGAYISYSTHKLSSTKKVSDTADAANRTASCAIEAGRTYRISMDMDARFRGAASAGVQTGTELTNYFIDSSDLNGTARTGRRETAVLTAGEGQDTLLIFYWTQYDGCTPFRTVRDSIIVLDMSGVTLPDGSSSYPPVSDGTDNGSGAGTNAGAVCPLDGQHHGTGFIGRLILFFHTIIYFIRHLFGAV